MAQLTMLARANDGLLLAEHSELAQSDLEHFRHDGKMLVRKLSNEASVDSRGSIVSGDHCFHYLINNGVIYLTLVSHSFPRKLAFHYLNDVHQAFSNEHISSVSSVTRPFAFLTFGETTVARLKRQYDDTRSKQNVERLNEDLMEISNVMQQNISDILQQGERLDQMSEMSSRLSSESKRYASNARSLSRQAIVRKIAPYLALVVFLFSVLVLRRLLKYFFPSR